MNDVIANKLSMRAKGIEGSGIRRLADMASQLKNPIDFSIGQPDFPVPEPVRLAAVQAIQSHRNHYTPTQGIEPLRARVARKLNDQNGIRVEAEDVLITTGSSGAIFLTYAAILDPGDEIVIPDPYFVMYPQLALAYFGARPVLVDTYPDFQLDPQKVAAAITPKTKAIMLNSPTNPSGSVVPESTLREIVRIADQHGLFLISDEVYESFCYDGQEHFSVGSIYPLTVTINGFSKSHAATGWRIGYAAGPRALMDKMRELQQYTYVCAPINAQIGALAALDVDTSAEVAGYQRRRDLVYEGLRERFDVVKPAGAFYIMPKVDEQDSTGFVMRALQNNVLVVPGAVFSRRNSHIRMSYAIPEARIQEGVEILRKL
jgi:aspartate/methionine/tyrosine aminotransferase